MNTHLIVPRLSARRASPSWFESIFEPRLEPAWNSASLDRLFGDFGSAQRVLGDCDFAPAIDVESSDTEIRLTADLPGLENKDFEVLVEDSVLTIKGEKRIERTSETSRQRRFERSSGSFERRFELGWAPDPESVKAAYRNGVLQVVIPKPSEVQNPVRKIPVTSSDAG